MNNTLQIPHPDEERSFSELRDEFREANHQRIKRQLQTQVVKVGPLTYLYQTDAKSASVDCTLTDDGRWLSTKAFPVDVPEKYLRELDRNARDVEQDLKACLPDDMGVDHDGPQLDSLDDESILDYTERLVKESNDSR